MKTENQIVPRWVLLLTAVFTLVAIADLPYDFFRLLRWLTFSVVIALVVEKFRSNHMGWVWPLGVIALIFNPLFPFHFEKEIWPIFNIGAALIFLGVYFQEVKERNGVLWKRLQAIFKPVPLMAGLVIVLVMSGVWLSYSSQRQAETQRREMALREANKKALAEEIRLDHEQESRMLLEAKFREERLQRERQQREELEQQAAIDRKIEAERIKKALQISKTDCRQVDVFDCLLDRGELTGKITNGLQRSVVDVALKVSIFKTIHGEWHFEKGKGIVKDTEDSKELLTVEHVVVPGPFNTGERKAFEIRFPNNLGFYKYEALAEIEGASYVHHKEELATDPEELEWEEITDPEELKEAEALFEEMQPASQAPIVPNTHYGTKNTLTQ